MDTDGVIQLFSLLILVFLSAFFSSAETALTTVNRVRLKALADEGNKHAQTALDILDKYGKMLSAILIGNNIVNLTASSLMTIVAMKIRLSVGIATGNRTEKYGHDLFRKAGAFLCGADCRADEGDDPGNLCGR